MHAPFMAAATKPAKSTAAQGSPVTPGDARWLVLLTVGLLTLGVVCRLVRYAVAPPLWCDEVFVALNLIPGDYRRLMGPLEFSQITPVLFLWAELAAYQLFGSSEWALRLIPLLAGLAALPLFWHLSRMTLPPLAATLATGILAAARWPMAMSNLVKPYSLDLLLSVALITLAVHWLRQPRRLRFLVLLVVLGPVALFASYPAVFVTGAIGLLLLGEACRGDWRVRALYVAFAVGTAAAFLGSFGIGQAQLGPDDGATRATYLEFWRDGFLPTSSPLAAGRWLLAAHTGELMSYPAGDRNGASTLTLLFCAAGAWWCARHRHQLLLVCALPFGLSLAASALRKYPYGVEPRLEQHLAPFICLLGGAGAASLIERFTRTPRGRLRAACAACGLLAACGVAVSFMGTSKPSYWEREALWSWKIANEIRGQANGGDQVVVLDRQESVLPTLRWQLLRLGNRVAWNGQADWERLRGTDNRLWLVSIRNGPERPYAQGVTLDGGTESSLWSLRRTQAPARTVRSELQECLDRGGQSWSPVDHVTYTLQANDCDSPPTRCDIFLSWPKGQINTRPRYLFSSWPR
jgi:hypothetical protein